MGVEAEPFPLPVEERKTSVEEGKKIRHLEEEVVMKTSQVEEEKR